MRGLKSKLMDEKGTGNKIHFSLLLEPMRVLNETHYSIKIPSSPSVVTNHFKLIPQTGRENFAFKY